MPETPTHNPPIDWKRSLPFFVMHLMPLGALFTGVHLADVVLCVSLYFGRMFFITAGYHRYFAHRSYKLGRVAQFVMAFGGSLAAQKGVLWWAGHHRNHHLYADTPNDIHSPQRGFWWSHMGWFLSQAYVSTPDHMITDFTKYPELRWINKYHLVPPLLLALTVLFFGGWSALFVGFFLSTVFLYHGVFSINSLAHVFGRRRYVTTDTSRNSLLLALLTCGEGWHNNHHYYRSSANQGFFWWEIDVSFYVLKMLSWVHIAKNLRRPPFLVLTKNLVAKGKSMAVLTTSKLKERAGEIYEEKRRDVQETVGKSIESTKRFTNQLADQTTKLADQLADGTTKMADQLVDQTHKLANQLTETTNRVAETTGRAIEQYAKTPIQSNKVV